MFHWFVCFHTVGFVESECVCVIIIRASLQNAQDTDASGKISWSKHENDQYIQMYVLQWTVDNKRNNTENTV
jgi:hypothetical protein